MKTMGVLEFEEHILNVESRHKEIENCTDDEKWRYILLCEMSFLYGARMLNIYQSIVLLMINDWNLISLSSEVTKLSQLQLKQNFLVCIASIDRNLLCMYCSNSILDLMKTVSSDIARFIGTGSKIFTKHDECSSAGSSPSIALTEFDDELSASPIEKGYNMSYRIQHYIFTEDTLNLFMPLLATMIRLIGKHAPRSIRKVDFK